MNEIDITIRPVGYATVADIHNQIPEFLASGDRRTSESFEAKVGRSRVHVIRALVNGEDAGYMVSHDRFRDGSIYCWMAGVIPGYRGRGVLKAMMSNLETAARVHGFKSIRIKTKNSRREMLTYLIKEGYSITDIEKYPDIVDNQISFIKRLAG
jgi:GNAT superfamily N-acetyltransferase